MKATPLILLTAILFLYVNIEIESDSPCSVFAKNPSLCNSDNFEDK